jgi:8-oxo-dGTP pyrophosphatase MutT (NUDIX family)
MRVLFELDKKDYGENDERYFRPSVRAIIKKDSRFAMVHSRKYDYYKFPGGGIEAGEDHVSALIREVREETGLTVDAASVREYGMVRRSQKGKSEGTVFVQDNFYYLCEVLDGNIGQNLDDYESEEGFTLEYVTAEKVIETNRNADHGAMNEDEFYQLMIERDARVMEMIVRTF